MADPKTWPRLTTDRLVLRPFSLEDAKDVQRLAGDREVAATTQEARHMTKNPASGRVMEKAGMLTLRDMGSYPSPPPCGAPRAPRRWPLGASFSRSCSREPAARSRNPARALTRRLPRPPKRR